MFPTDLLQAPTFDSFRASLERRGGRVRNVKRVEHPDGAVFAIGYSTGYADGSARGTAWFDYAGERALNPAFAS